MVSQYVYLTISLFVTLFCHVSYFLFLLFILILEYEPIESYVSIVKAYQLLPTKGNLQSILTSSSL